MKSTKILLVLIAWFSHVDSIGISINLENQESNGFIRVMSTCGGTVKRYVPNSGVMVNHVHDGDLFVWRSYQNNVRCKSALVTLVDENTKILHLEIEADRPLSLYYRKKFMWLPIRVQEYNRMIPVDDPER
ncbi:signal peptide-containing protein [Theileria equi strain WA]|uniref:Signal peptide-containing protein n=1 Tax=Theileria equi strain WA TaxID=1537102 RepID=L0AVT9_THEEQ|nr:signal peptide-containing protein [Theileria equi strain WA]AFZ79665.1 signal peptide-containing protein [Theileria equi strain WA]|eukprot:XP_004829331.1 signal peptide-containing protein [Theileria equi strain WA]